MAAASSKSSSRGVVRWSQLALFLLAVTSSCGRSPDDEAAADDRATAIVDQFFSQRNAPGSAAVHIEYEQAVQDCMRAQGFDYELAPYQPVAQQEPMSFWLNPDLDAARRHGFGIADQLVSTDSELAPVGVEQQAGGDEGVDAEQYAYSVEYETTLYGSEEGPGCVDEARDALVGSSGRVGREVLVGMATLLQQSVKIQQVEQQWSGCMAERGFDFASESDAISHVMNQAKDVSGSSSEFDGSSIADIRQMEIDISVADVQCIEQHVDDIQSEFGRLARQALEKSNS